jgi:Uma2 family endonuclease
MTSVLSPSTEVLLLPKEADVPDFKLPSTFTVNDLESLPDDYRYELHEGILHVMPPPIAWHSDVIWRVTAILRAAGMVAYPEIGVKFSEIDERQPDVAVFKNRPDKNERFFPPSDFLILVEVVSPSTRAQDRILKPFHYADAGVPEYWRVERDPDDDDDAFVHRYRLSAEGAYVETGTVELSGLEASLTRR